MMVSCPGCGMSGHAQQFSCVPADWSEGANPPNSAAVDLAIASRILASQGVLDAFGHVSCRDPQDHMSFYLSRSLAPALVTPQDIIKHSNEGEAAQNEHRPLFLERFIHSEIYRARQDVMAIVHSHSPSVIPFGVTGSPMMAMFHNAAFLAQGVPAFDISDLFGATDMLISDCTKGEQLAKSLSTSSVVVMRGHGSVAVGPTLEVAVFRAVFTEINARLQMQAMALSGGSKLRFITSEEGILADAVNIRVARRAWDVWCSSLGFTVQSR